MRNPLFHQELSPAIFHYKLCLLRSHSLAILWYQQESPAGVSEIVSAHQEEGRITLCV